MGFPVGCSELVLPRVLVWLIFLLSALRRVITWCLASVGLGDLLDVDGFILAGAAGASSASFNPPAPHYSSYYHHTHQQGPRALSPSLVLSKIPSAPYLPRQAGDGSHCDQLESCAVCLYEFEGGEEVRELEMCRHVFHRCCIDPWIQIGSRTCPLCRAQIVSEEDEATAVAGSDDATASSSSPAPYYHYDEYQDDDPFQAYFGGDEGDYAALFPPLIQDDPFEARALHFISWPLPEAPQAFS